MSSRGAGGSVDRIPELLTMVNSPTVAGALTSLIGPGYAHGQLGAPGCALHVSTNEDQIFHKDTQVRRSFGRFSRAHAAASSSNRLLSWLSSVRTSPSVAPSRTIGPAT